MPIPIEELDEFQRSFIRVMKIMQKFQKTLSSRERVILSIGLRASHIEESLMIGDEQRAMAHLHGLVELAKKL